MRGKQNKSKYPVSGNQGKNKTTSILCNSSFFRLSSRLRTQAVSQRMEQASPDRSSMPPSAPDVSLRGNLSGLKAQGYGGYIYIGNSNYHSPEVRMQGLNQLQKQLEEGRAHLRSQFEATVDYGRERWRHECEALAVLCLYLESREADIGIEFIFSSLPFQLVWDPSLQGEHSLINETSLETPSQTSLEACHLGDSKCHHVENQD